MMKERAAEDASEDTSKLATSSHNRNGKTTEGGLDNAAFDGDDRTAMNDVPPIVDNKNGVELVNMNVTPGKTNGSDFTHYYMPVNTHKKLLRGEKLYVTRDPRTRGISRRKVLICAIVWFLIVVVFVLAVLAAMGILFTSPAPSESSNQSTYLTLGTDVPTVVDQDDSTFNGVSSPQTMQLEFKITNLLFDNHLLDENSLHFKSLQNRLKNELYHVFLPLRVWKVVVNKFSEGSVIVHSLLYWSPNQPVLITISELSDRFIDFLQESNAFLGPYSVEMSSVSISEVTESPDAKETRPSEYGRGISGDWSTGTQTSTTDLWSILAGWTTEKATTREEEQTTYSPTVHFHQYDTETESTAFEDHSTPSTNNAAETSDLETTTTEESITTITTSSEQSTTDYQVCGGTQVCVRNDTPQEYSTTEIEPTDNETTESSVSTVTTILDDNSTTKTSPTFIIPPFVTMEDVTTTTMPETNTTTDFVFPTIEDIINATLNETDHEESTMPVVTTLNDNATTDFIYTALFNNATTDFIYPGLFNNATTDFNNATTANETTETSLLLNFTGFYDNVSTSTTFFAVNLTKTEMTLNESTTEDIETFERSTTVSDINNRTTEVEEIDQTSTFFQHDAMNNTSVFANYTTEASEVTVDISALETTFTTGASMDNNVTTQSSIDTSESTPTTQKLSSTERELTEVTTVNATNIEDLTTLPPSSDEVDYANKNTIEGELATKINNKSITESTTVGETIKTTQISSGEVDYANKSAEETETTTILHENEVTEAATMQSAAETTTQITIMPKNDTIEETTTMHNNATVMETTTTHNNASITETTTMSNNETAAETKLMHNNETTVGITETTMLHNNETAVGITETTMMHNNETTVGITETTMTHNNETTVGITETTMMHNNETTIGITETTVSDIISSIENETNEKSTTSTSVFEAEEGAGEVTYSSNENSRRR